MHEATLDGGLVCRRHGISPAMLRKWWDRYHANGIEGLKEYEHTSSPIAEDEGDVDGRTWR